MRGAAASGDIGPIMAFAGISTIMLAASITAHIIAPPPLAPRIHVRWSEDAPLAQRTRLEHQFRLVAARHRDGTTWEYDMADPSHSTIQALIDHPAVSDTHYIDRANGQVSTDAPRGTTEVDRPGVAKWIHSPVFDWFLSFWVSASVVSFVRLASFRKSPQR